MNPYNPFDGLPMPDTSSANEYIDCAKAAHHVGKTNLSFAFIQWRTNLLVDRMDWEENRKQENKILTAAVSRYLERKANGSKNRQNV